MRINIEIANEVTEYSFDENNIFIGSSSDCHISLPYEGIGRAHLEISYEEGSYFVSELGSGEKTFLNGEEVSPSSKFEFNSFFPVEIGGIFIYLVDEVVESEDSLDSKLTELSEDITAAFNTSNLDLVDAKKDSNSDSIEDIARKKVEAAYDEISSPKKPDKAILDDLKKSEDSTGQKKYKPDIYVPTGNTITGTGSKSFKIKTPTMKTSTKKIKKSTKKKITKKKTKRKSTRKSHNKGSAIIFAMVAIITGSIYYFNYYEPKQEKVALNKNTKVANKYDVSTGLEQNFERYLSKYNFFVNSKKCTSLLEKTFCNVFTSSQKLEDYEGVKKIGDTLYIGLTADSLKLSLSSSLRDQNVSEGLLKSLIEKQYSEFFSYEDFVANNYKAPLQAYKFNYDLYEQVSQMLILSLQEEFRTLLKKIEQEGKVHFFVLEEFQKEVKILSFIDFNKAHIKIIEESLEDSLQFLNLNLKHYLNEGVEDFFKSKLSTHLDAYDDTLYLAYQERKLIKGLNKYLDMPLCSEVNTKEICTILKSIRGEQGGEGAIIEGNSLYILVNEAISIKLNKKKFSEHAYSVPERKELLKSAIALGSKFDKKEFFKNDFVYKDKDSDGKFSLSVLMSDFINADLYQVIMEQVAIKEIRLISYAINSNNKKELRANIVLDKSRLAKTDIGINKQNKIFLWRSAIPAYTRFIRNKSLFFKGFSKTQ